MMIFGLCAFTVFGMTKEEFTAELEKVGSYIAMTEAQKKAEIKKIMQAALASGLDQAAVVQVSVETSGLDPVETVSLLVQEGVEEKALAGGTDAAGISSTVVTQGKQQAELAQEEGQEQFTTITETPFLLTEEQFSEELASINENTEMTDAQKQAAVESLIKEALSSGLDQAFVVQVSIEASGLNPVAVVSFLVQEGVDENAVVSGADSAGVSPGIVAQAQKQAEIAMGVRSADSGELGFSDSPAPAPVAIVTGPVAGGRGNKPASPSTP